MSSILRRGDDVTGRRLGSTAFLLIAIFTMAGSLLRFRNLASRDFWFDESCTFIYVHHLFDWQVGRSLLVESTNLPYYVLLRAWTHVFGESETAYRALSALAAALTIPLLSLTAVRLVVTSTPEVRLRASGDSPSKGRLDNGTPAPASIHASTFAIVTAFIAALHPLHIFYANEARAYALWVFLLTGSLLLVVESLRRSSLAWWAGYCVVTLLATLTHYFTLFWIPATFSLILVSNQPRHALRRLFVANSIILAIFTPYFLLAVLPACGGGQAWIAASFHPIAAIIQSLWSMMPSGHYPAHLRGLSLDSPDTRRNAPAAVEVLAALLPVVILAGVILSSVRQAHRKGRAPDSRPLLALAMFTLVPLLPALAFSLLVRPIYLAGRYDLVSWPTFVLLTAMILVRMRDLTFLHRMRRTHASAVWIGTLAVIGLCSWVPIRRHAALKPPPTVHHRRADVLAGLARRDDLVIAFNYDRAAMLYYLHRAGFQGTMVSFPSWLDDQIGWVDDAADLDPARADAVRADAARQAARIKDRIKSGHRAFTLVDSIDPKREGARAPLDDALLREALAHRLEPHLIDEELLIFEWKAAGG